MGILIKYTLRNIKAHKFRTFLILLSIMLSVGLFFASFSISDTLTDVIMGEIKSSIGTAEIMVMSGMNSNSEKVKIKELGDAGANVEYQVGVVEQYVSYRNSERKTQNVSMKGYRLQDLEIVNPVQYQAFMGEDSFKGKVAIIGQSFAEKENIKIGENVKLKFSNDDIKPFKVVGIAKNTGFFKTNTMFGEDSIQMIVPRETLSRFLGSIDSMNSIYIKTKDDALVDQTVEDLKTVYKTEMVNVMITQGQIEAEIKPIRIPFMFMMILVILISIFIIFTSFKVITMERLPMLGTFRSIGATKKMTDIIMLSEAFLYGISGSILGGVLGHYMLVVVTNLIADGLAVDRIIYPPINMVMALSFGIILSVGSSFIPIARTSKIPIKEILLNIVEGTKKKRKHVRYVVGAILGILAIGLPIAFSEGMQAAFSGAVSIIFMILALVCFVPLLTDGIIRISEKIFGVVFGNIGLLSVRNMRGNKSTYDNVILLTIGLASMLTISMMGSSIQEETLSYYNTRTFDINVYADSAGKTTMQRILSIDGISNSISYQSTGRSFNYENEEEYFIRRLLGIDNENVLDFFNYDILNHDDDDEVIKELLTGRKLILGTVLRDKYNLKEGQTVRLKTKVGMRDYEILGFVSTKEGNGKFAITAQRNLQSDLKKSWGLQMAIKVKKGYSTDEVISKVNDKLKRMDWFQVDSIENQKQQSLEGNNKVIIIISAFSVATALIGSIGVMNNFIVSFLSRKKSLAVYASVGMSQSQRKLMLLIEAISCGIVGAVFGMVTAQLIIMRVVSLFQKIEVAMNMNLTMHAMTFGLIGAVAVCLLSSIGMLRRSGKVSIVEELKCE